jgi:hypothetical protein
MKREKRCELCTRSIYKLWTNYEAADIAGTAGTAEEFCAAAGTTGGLSRVHFMPNWL